MKDKDKRDKSKDNYKSKDKRDQSKDKRDKK